MRSSPLPEFAAAIASRYRITREVGAGGMATVWLADDLAHERQVAVKVLHPELAAAVGAMRFRREVQVTARLVHPNILPLLDSGECAGLLYYVTPYVLGESLRHRLRRERQLPLDDALAITREVAAALDYAHRAGVVHRDVKPENILLQDGHALVSDFGIAQTANAGVEALTVTGLTIGTAAYMSPEQASGEHDLDGRSDIYSLGCVLYEMLAGEPPFTGATPRAVLSKQLVSVAPSVGTLRDSIPRPVVSAVARALAKTPADRFTTAAEFSAALGAVPGATHATSKKAWLGIVGASVMAALAIAAWFVVGDRVGGVTVRPSAPVRKTRPGPQPSDSVAQALYQRARHQIARRSSEGSVQAVTLLRQVVEREPGFAEGWAELANALQGVWIWRYPIPGLAADSVMPLMVAASERAIALDSSSSSAWVARAIVLRQVDPTTRRDMLAALARAISLDSANADAWFYSAIAWEDSLEHDRALAAYRRAVAADPRHLPALGFLGLHWSWRRQFDSATVWADSGRRLDPSVLSPRQSLAFASLFAGDLGRAEDEFRASVRIGAGPEQTMAFAGLADIAWRRGARMAADTILARAVAGTDTLRPSLHDAAYVAWAFAATGRRERALRLLERFEPRNDKHFQMHLRRDPGLDSLRADSRFIALLGGDPSRSGSSGPRR